MDRAQWPQEMVVKPIEEIVVTNNNNNKNTCANLKAVERKPRPQKEAALNCPRCHSTNTKFCYYNNYSLTQPRYFCKTCRRYWTEGGSLRNIPVGGGSSKNKRSPSSSNSSASPSNLPDLVTVTSKPSTCRSTLQNPKIPQGQDLKLAFPDFGNISELVQQNNNNSLSAANSAASSSSSTATAAVTSASTSQLSALGLLTEITSSSRGLNSFMPLQPDPDPNTVYPCGFPPLQQDFKPTLKFSLDGIGSIQDTSGRLLFPFEDLKVQVSTTTESANTMEEHQHNNNNNNSKETGYWTGTWGGSGSW